MVRNRWIENFKLAVASGLSLISGCLRKRPPAQPSASSCAVARSMKVSRMTAGEAMRINVRQLQLGD